MANHNHHHRVMTPRKPSLSRTLTTDRPTLHIMHPVKSGSSLAERNREEPSLAAWRSLDLAARLVSARAHTLWLAARAESVPSVMLVDGPSRR